MARGSYPYNAFTALYWGNLLKVHDVLEIPAYDELAAADSCQRNVKRIIFPRRREDPSIQTGLLKVECLIGNLGDRGLRKQRLEIRANP